MPGLFEETARRLLFPRNRSWCRFSVTDLRSRWLVRRYSTQSWRVTLGTAWKKRHSLGGVVIGVGLMYGGKNRRFGPSLTEERRDCCQYCVFQTQRHFDQSDRRGGKRRRKNLKPPKDGSTLPNTSYQGEVELVNARPGGSIINANYSITIIIITNTSNSIIWSMISDHKRHCSYYHEW